MPLYYLKATFYRLKIKSILAQGGIETVEAAYDVFLRHGFEDFQQYAFELQTCAAKNLNPQRVKEYLGIIFQQQGLAVTQVKP